MSTDVIRSKAAAYLTRTGNADLLPVLGLVDEPDEALVIDGRRLCPTCRRPLPDPIRNGGRKPCRRCGKQGDR